MFIMKNLVLLLCFFISLSVSASEYGVYSPDKYSLKQNGEEMTLFIMDFSSSMDEYLENDTKFDLMLSTMKKILPTINPNSLVGLRVYGHKMGFTPFDACRASSLIVPIQRGNGYNIHYNLTQLKPKGMTPITYSLKQAVKNDFIGFSGKKHIILLTDGGENCDESPCKFVMELIKVRKDIVIDVIAFNIDNPDDIAQLQCTSLVTSGKFYSANTAAELANSLTNSLNVHKEVEAKILPNP